MSENVSNSELHPMESLLDAYLNFGVPKVGDIREGNVVARRSNEVLVDIGAKSEGIIPGSELVDLSQDQKLDLSIGNSVRVCVMNTEDDHGHLVLSYLKVAEAEDWQVAQDLVESQEPSECRVIGHNRGGLLTKLGSLRGFIPASQLGADHQIKRNMPTDVQLKALVGETLAVKVLEADRDRERLILSELAADQETRESRRATRIAEIDEGAVYDGRVINLTDFGAFIDIGGIEGLVHLSEISWKHFKRPSDVLSVGDTVKVSVLSIDSEKQHINLSLKKQETNPWNEVEALYPIGKLVEVTITQLTRYGAFARINDDFRLEGLIHISELSDEHIKTPDEVVSKGQNATARIIRLDPSQRQIGFSIKQVFSEKYMELDLATNQPAEE